MLSQLVIPHKTYILLKDGNPVKTQSHLVGFQSKYLATHATSYIDSLPVLTHNPIDMTAVINANLSRWHLKYRFKNVKMDVNGHIQLVKHTQKAYMLQTISYKDFLCESYENNLGIALVTHIEQEVDSSVVYKAQFVEPAPQDDNVIGALGFLIPLWRQFPLLIEDTPIHKG